MVRRQTLHQFATRLRQLTSGKTKLAQEMKPELVLGIETEPKELVLLFYSTNNWLE
jgi:hypothetical protein